MFGSDRIAYQGVYVTAMVALFPEEALMRLSKLFIVTSLLLGFGLAQPAAATNVEVKFSPRIQENLKSLNIIEKKREAFFRKYREEGANRIPNSIVNVARFSGTEFGTERLIPDVEDFSVAALVEAMATYNVAQVKGHDKSHRLVVEIDKFFASNYSLAKFSSFNTRMSGRVSLVDASGKTVASEKVSTVIVPQFTGNRSYTGSEYAFLGQSMNVRMAPVLASFLRKGIRKLYPDADVPGPIFLRE